MNMDALPVSAKTPVAELAAVLKDRLGDTLLSLTLVGSVLADDYCPKRSDINSVLVVRENTPEILDILSEIGPKMGRSRLSAPLLMWPTYIQRSCDVFAVEWLDFQWRHQTLLGPDPFAPLTFAKPDVRLQCERQYKSALIRLRQGYIGLARKPAAIAQQLAAAGRDLLPYLRATLWLCDVERPASSARTFEQAGRRFNVPLAALAERHAARYQKSRLTAEAARSAFWQTCQSLEQLADSIDKLEV
jgi:hypothetical protein